MAGKVKLTKVHVRNMARAYIADLLVQEQMPPVHFEEHDAELFMEEIQHVAMRVRASITPAGRAALSPQAGSNNE